MMVLRVKSLAYVTNKYTTIRCMSSKSSNYDYQFMQNSKIPTLHFQKSLPRLPIPKLSDTCSKYLAAQRPILTREQFSETEKHVARFQTSEGNVLQTLLQAKDKKNSHTSYITEPWFHMYLSDRIPLPINYNPAIIFQNDVKGNYNTQLLKSTNMLISSLRFMRSLRKNILEPEVFHINPAKSDTPLFRTITSALPSFASWYGAYMFNAYPLDMSQYSKLFNSSRIPTPNKDALYQDVSARHVLVMRKGYFYAIDVLDEAGHILPPIVLLSRMKSVLDDPCPFAPTPLGVLTTENRDTWADVRCHMHSIAENQSFLQKIDSALFNIVLDEEEIGSDPITMVRHFLHGSGTNRWFDKSFSLIVSKDGTAGVNFEHSWGDGVAVLRYFQDVYKDSVNNPQVHPDSSITDDGRPQKLGFQVDDKVKLSVENAFKKYSSTCDSLDVNFFMIEGVGKKLCKKHSISPDSLMQLGFQAAYHKQNNKFVASYESCSTAAFKHGRTETIRPCTMETSRYSLAVNGSASKTDLLPLIVNCSNVHKNLTRDAAMGQGFDRHLFALRLTAAENDFPQVMIFEDPAYANINKNVISSSTLSSPAIQYGGFGPVVPDGYGIAYMIMDDALGAVVTNYRDHSSGSDFIRCMKTSFEQLRDVLVKSR